MEQILLASHFIDKQPETQGDLSDLPGHAYTKTEQATRQCKLFNPLQICTSKEEASECVHGWLMVS